MNAFKLYKTKQGIILNEKNDYYSIENISWDNLVNRTGLYDFLYEILPDRQTSTNADSDDSDLKFTLLPPIGSQEVWAAGVTYLRSKKARMEESEKSRGDLFYDKVYTAERPELFFKANADQVVGPGGSVRIRKDSTWNVPEPELTLFISSEGTIEGYTIGNDMSSRSIEGENPLYLPQAKVYDHSASMGPCLYIPKKPLDGNTGIALKIYRMNELVFEGETKISQIKRELKELVYYLYLEKSFPRGCYLMTGTGIVPPNDFTLHVEDLIEIKIDGIGTLSNVVRKES